MSIMVIRDARRKASASAQVDVQVDVQGEIVAGRLGLAQPSGVEVYSGGARSGLLASLRSRGVLAEYKVWWRMHRRCADPENPDYADYGGRGITVCARWASFENFLADMGKRPPGRLRKALFSLDRKNNDGNYEPGNCRWVTDIVQNNNKRTAKTARRWRLVEGAGVALTPAQARYVEVLRKGRPTVREIAAAVGVRSTNGVHQMLEVLERKGVVCR
jgi:hypothetical protein